MKNIITDIKTINKICETFEGKDGMKGYDMTIELADNVFTIVALGERDPDEPIMIYVYVRLFFENDPDADPQFVITWAPDPEGGMSKPKGTKPNGEVISDEFAHMFAHIYYACTMFVNSSDEYRSYETQDEDWGKWLEHLVITDRPDLICYGMSGEKEYVRPCAIEESLMAGSKEPYHGMRYYDYLKRGK